VASAEGYGDEAFAHQYIAVIVISGTNEHLQLLSHESLGLFHSFSLAASPNKVGNRLPDLRLKPNLDFYIKKDEKYKNILPVVVCGIFVSKSC
jgi:hypothetical protein